jgi:hypothetical protein
MQPWVLFGDVFFYLFRPLYAIFIEVIYKEIHL